MTKVFQSLEEEKLEAVNIAKRNERHDTNVEIAKSLLLNSGILSSCSNTSLLTSHSLCL